MTSGLRAACGAAALIVGLRAVAGHAQTCWVYTDGQQAKVPIKCVSKTNLSAPCTWDSDGDGVGDSDCTTVQVPGPQKIREMHEIWHQCFGATGGATPPAGRSARWYAFHRQFEFDFNTWRRGISIAPIESLEWCPGMNMPIGTGPTPTSHPAGCGTGTPRPDNTPCPRCVAFPHCLFHAGGGPIACPNAPSATCSTPDGGVSFSYTSLEQFKNVDEVAKILDGQFHGLMHSATALADRTPATSCNPPGTTSGCYNLDSLGSDCSPRDPMFWRLHHALDDVVRAWQDAKAVDVVVVVDRSGSMSDPDAGGGTKLQAALAALDNFADLLEDGRSDGQVNRIGIVSYSSTATADLPLTVVDANLRAPGGPLKTAINTIATNGPGGCTGIGGALEQAIQMLCPPGNCQGFSASGDNDRKAILLLTDGVENESPCLAPAGASGPACGTQCFGAQLDWAKLEFTQIVAVGFGNGATLNGPLLALLTERQGGIYMQNPNTPGNDLKDFFAKAFGQLSSEFLLLDPKGTLAAGAVATDPVAYTGCADSMLTFASGWNDAVKLGDLSLVVESPNTDLVLHRAPGVESSQQPLWDFSRVALPYRGARSGAWRAQLVRRHRLFVNGFTPDAFAVPDEGVTLVRREIHRLCPDGCKRAILYEGGRRGATSAYRDALAAEEQAGVLGSVTVTTDDGKFAGALTPGRWDLVVSAEMGPDTARPYDAPLARLLCDGQRAILTDVRQNARGAVFECTQTRGTAPVNWTTVEPGDGRLVDHPLKLMNPGYPVFSYGVVGPSLEAMSNARVASIAVRADPGTDQNWFIDVLGKSLAKLSPHNRALDWKTGSAPIATTHILPSYIRSGGWDHVDARVEVESPRLSVGRLLARRGLGDPRRVNGELIDPRTAALANLVVPTFTATFPLYDDGTHADLYPGNGYWTGELTGLGKVDGLYKLRFMFDLTADGCTTHRELVQSVYMDVGVHPKGTKVSAGVAGAAARGWRKVKLSVTPGDAFGNPVGAGRPTAVTCAPADSCDVEREMVDAGNGTYTVSGAVARNVASVRLTAFGTDLDVPVACPGCPRLAGIVVHPKSVVNQQPAQGRVTLSGRAPRTPDGGAVVFLESDLRRVASVPESVVVPAGKKSVAFPVTVYHVHVEPEIVHLTAHYGGKRVGAALTVSPLGSGQSYGPARAPTDYLMNHGHHHDE